MSRKKDLFVTLTVVAVPYTNNRKNNIYICFLVGKKYIYIMTAFFSSNLFFVTRNVTHFCFYIFYYYIFNLRVIFNVTSERKLEST